MEDLTSGAKGMTISDDLEKTPKERADLFYSYVKQRHDQGLLTKPGVDKDIVMEAERLDVKDKAPLVLCELIFDTNILTQVSRLFIFHLYTPVQEVVTNLILILDENLSSFIVSVHSRQR
jgi:translation initiation factor 5